MAHSAPSLSIIIPAYNEEDRLGPTFELLRAWMDAAERDIQVLVVDDGSSDGTAALVAMVQAVGQKNDASNGTSSW